MKATKTLIVLLWLAALNPAFGQKDPVERLFEKYAGKEGYTTVYISSKMFSMFSGAGIDDPEFNDLMKNLKSIRILSEDDHSKADFYREVIDALPAGEYEELMTVTEPGQKLKFLVKEKEGKVVELLMVSGGGGDNVLIDIRGDINMKEIAQLSKAIHIDGLEELDKLKE